MKAVRRDNCTVDRRGARKAVRASSLFLSIFPNFIIFTNPVAVVQTVSLIFNFGWINAIALVVILVGGMVIGAMLRHFYDSHIWKQIINHYFREFDDWIFEPITIDGLEQLEQDSTNTWDVIRSMPEMFPFLISLVMPTIRAFYVYPNPDRKVRSFISALKAYQMGSGTTYVFLLQRKRLEEMRFDSKFFLLHEIGHATVANQIIGMSVWIAVSNFCLLFIFVVFHREQAGILALLVVLALAAMWAYCFLQQQRKADERTELIADAFALVHLARSPDFLTSIDHLASDFRKRSDNPHFWRYRAELLVRRAQILSRTGLEFSSRAGTNWLEETVLPVPVWLTLLTFAGMLWLGTTLTIKNWKELGALSLLWLVGPALWFYYYTFVRVHLTRTARARRVALKFLQAHAPPDLPVERQVKTVFDLI